MPFNLAIPKRQLTLSKFGGLYTEADPRDLPEGASPLNWDVDFVISGVDPRPGLSKAISTFSGGVPSLLQWINSAALPGSLYETIAQDSGGRLWAENLASPGTLTAIYSGIINNARAVSDTVNNREYICLSNLSSGKDQPRQWDGVYLDRISQVGPGAPPAVPTAAVPAYAINSIGPIYTSHSIDTVIWGALLNDQNAPPPSGQIAFMGVAADYTFTIGLYVGDTVYVSGVPNMDGQNPNGTYAVTGIGYFTDGNGTHQYFTVTSELLVGDFIRGGSGGTYQKTQSLVQISPPLPQQDAIVGGSITISGCAVQGWNEQWTIVQTPSLGQLSISATSLTTNVATYTYSVTSGEAPGWQASYQYLQGSQIVSPAGDTWQITTPGVSGALIPAFAVSPQADDTAVWEKQTGVHVVATVFNTNNGNGIFNVQNAIITYADTTTFRIALTSPDIGAASEQGLAVTGSGSVLIIDPGLSATGSGHPGTDPIFSSATTGTVLPVVAQVAAGQRYAVMMFLTRDNYLSPASPPVSFYTTGSTSTLSFTKMAIGPPNVTARVIAVTAANSGVGGPYFWIPEDVILQASAASLGQTQTINKTVVYDNTSTSFGPITISDTVLLQSENISIEGNNLQQQRELGECVKPVQFAGRVFYLGERTKNDLLVNMTFDGGSISGTPAGWTIATTLAAYVSLVTSQVFGQSLYIHNTSGGTLNPTGTLLASILSVYQGAYETVSQSPILTPNVAYSVRVTARIPSNNTNGSLIVELYSPNAGSSWKATIPFASLSTTLSENVLAFSNPLWQPVPSDLVLRVYPSNIANGADVEVDRIEVFPTLQPVYSGQTIGSYYENSEAIDLVTGPVSIQQYTSNPATNHFYLKFTKKYYITTGSQTFSPIDGDTEPSSWRVEPVSDVGSCGPLAEDSGEEYVIVAEQQGAYVFDGGSHIKFSQEIQQIWDSIYQPSLKTIWIKNDVARQRILIGVPLPTPNQWLPNALTNAAPATPNVVLMCSYLGCRNGREIGENSAVHVSAFTGNLLWRDTGRKWSIWQIPAPYGAFISRPDGSRQFWLAQQAAVSYLDKTVNTDNGSPILESYTTYAMSDGMNDERLQLGSVRKVFGYASVLAEGTGSFDFTIYPETLSTPYFTTQPAFGLSNPALDDTNIPLNETGNRMFMQISTDGAAGSAFSLKRVVLGVWPDTRIPVSGR